MAGHRFNLDLRRRFAPTRAQLGPVVRNRGPPRDGSLKATLRFRGFINTTIGGFSYWEFLPNISGFSTTFLESDVFLCLKTSLGKWSSRFFLYSACNYCLTLNMFLNSKCTSMLFVHILWITVPIVWISIRKGPVTLEG